MASTTYLQQAYLAYFGRPADVSGLSFYASRTEAQVVAAFSASPESQAFFGSLITSAQIEAIYQNLFNRAAENAGLTYWSNEISTGRLSLAQASMGILAGAQNDDKLAVTNKLAAATAFTAALDTSAEMAGYQGSSAITAARAYLAPVGSTAASLTAATTTAALSASVATVVAAGTAGEIFPLTTGDDTFTGTTSDDTYTATTSTLSADDKILDASITDNDELNITATADPAVMDVSNVENININWNSFSTADIDLSDVSGATVTITSTKSGYLGNVNFTEVGDNNIATGAGVTGTLTIDGIEDATVTSTLADEIDIGGTTAADGVITVVAGAAETVTIVGGDDIILTALVADDISLTAGFDTAELNLGVDADVTVDGADDSVVTINSDEDITVTIEAASEYETLIVGGEGTVTLVIDAAADLDGLTITNTDGDVELDVALAADADFSLVSADNIIFTTEMGADVALTIATGQSLVFEDDQGFEITVQITEDDDGSADSATITLEAVQAEAFIFTTTDQEVETVNIVIDADSDFDDETDFTIADLQGTSAAGTVFVIASSDDDIEVVVTAADASEIDASAVEGDFTLTGQTSDEELTIMGAVGDTTVTFAGEIEDSTYSGQDGDDTVAFITTTGTATAILGDGDNTVTAAGVLATTGTVAVTAGSGDNTITITNATTGDVVAQLGAGDNTVTANSMTTGTLSVVTGAGDDVVSATAITSGEVDLELGAGANEITLGDVAGVLAGAEISITLGAGADTVEIGAADGDSAEISITFGTGTDTLVLTDTADLSDLTLSFTGLEQIEIATAGTGTVASSLVDGQSYLIFTSGTAGILTEVLAVEVQDGVTSFDGSSLEIDDTISAGVLGLTVTVVTAADDFTIVGSEGDDTITTGTGDDTITGGLGLDTMDAGTGDNVYIIGDDDSGITLLTADAIAAFVTGADTLSLGAAGSSTNYAEGDDEADFDDSLTAADALFLADAGDLLYVFITDTTDGFLFEDTDGDGDADVAIVLTGITDAADFAMADIVA